MFAPQFFQFDEDKYLFWTTDKFIVNKFCRCCLLLSLGYNRWVWCMVYMYVFLLQMCTMYACIVCCRVHMRQRHPHIFSLKLCTMRNVILQLAREIPKIWKKNVDNKWQKVFYYRITDNRPDKNNIQILCMCAIVFFHWENYTKHEISSIKFGFISFFLVQIIVYNI